MCFRFFASLLLACLLASGDTAFGSCKALLPGEALPKLKSSEVTQALVLQSIRLLHSEGFSVNYYAMKTDQGGSKAEALLTKFTGARTKPSFLLTASLKIHRDWNWWLAKAELNTDEARAHTRRLEKDFILSTIKWLYNQGVDVSRKSLQSQRNNSELKSLIFEKTGRSLSPAKLVEDAVHPYKNPYPKNWAWWLVQAGIDPAKSHNRTKRFTETQIIESIKALHENNYLISFAALLDARNEDRASEIIFQVTKQKATTEDLLKDAQLAHEKRWGWWIREAGLRLVLRSLQTKSLSEDLIVKLIKTLDEEGFAVNAGAFYDPRYNDSVKHIVEKVLGQKRSLGTIIRDAVYLHGKPWDTWLVRAGLNPMNIRLRGSAPLHLLTAAQRAELGSNYQSFTTHQKGLETSPNGYVSVIAVDTRTPEDDIVHKEFQDSFSDFYETLDEDRKELLDIVTDYFSSPGEMDLELIADYVIDRSEGQFTNEDVTEIVQRILRFPGFKNFSEN